MHWDDYDYGNAYAYGNVNGFAPIKLEVEKLHLKINLKKEYKSWGENIAPQDQFETRIEKWSPCFKKMAFSETMDG